MDKVWSFSVCRLSEEPLRLNRVWNCCVCWQYGAARFTDSVELLCVRTFFFLLYWNCSVYGQSVVWLLCLWTECGTCLLLFGVLFCFWHCGTALTVGKKSESALFMDRVWNCPVCVSSMDLLCGQSAVFGAALSVGTGMHTLSLLTCATVLHTLFHCSKTCIQLSMGAHWRIEVCVWGGGGGRKTTTSHTLNYKILSCLLLTLRNQ